MSADDLMLLERVFLRLGSAETDEQLENVLGKFLVPVLLKLSSVHESIRKKVMELLIHVNKRIKTRPNVQLPMEALINQYTDPAASSFVTNFTIIYIKSGFPRLSPDKQATLVPQIINALEGKPKPHLDSLLMLIVPLLGKVRVPTEPEKKKSLFDLDKNPDVAKYFLDILLDVLLLPYSSLSLQSQESDANQSNRVAMAVPSGMTEVSLKRIIANNAIKLEEFEAVKLGIVKFLSQDVFKPEEILLHLIVAAADTRFEVANLADMELKKILGFIDWTCPQVAQPIFLLFLGAKSAKPDRAKVPAGTRIRLKLLTYLCRVQGEACLFPYSLQIVFDSLYGENTNSKLKSLALNFTANLIRYSKGDSLKKVSPVLLVGLTKLLKGEETEHQGQAYVTISMLAQKFPHIVFSDVAILELYFNNLEAANPNLKLQVREGLLNLLVAYKHDIYPEEADRNGRLAILLALLKVKMNSGEPMVRFACVRTLSTIFPVGHVPSKFLLLVAIGDREDDVRQEAFKSIYGITRKTNFGEASEIDKSMLPSFSDITRLVYNETQKNTVDKSTAANAGGSALPFSANVYLEIILYLRLCLLRNLDVSLTRDVLKHPCEHTPKVAKQIRDVYGDPGGRETLTHYASLVRSLLLANSGLEPILCMTELVGSVPDLHSLLATDVDWISNQLSNVKEEIRENVAILYSLVLTQLTDGVDFDESMKCLIEQSGKNNLEAQHGALLGLANCLEAHALKKKRESAKFDKIELTKECINTIVPFTKNQNPLLVGGSCLCIGLIGRVISLPLDDGKAPDDGSPNRKKPAAEVNKLRAVEHLIDVMKNNKFSAKVREKAARSLGLLCVGERFIHTRHIVRGLLGTAAETKDVEVHFTIGESLLMCCQTVSSPQARDAWITLPEDHERDDSDPVIDETLDWCLNELLQLSGRQHPNSRQASCIWLLAILKGCGKRGPIAKRIQILQNTFMEFLCDNNDLIQDVASKGLCVIYDSFKSEDLLSALVNQLTLGTRHAVQVTSDTKIFDEGQLGKTPTGENLTTYKELCSLASDLNKPDLIYQFMHLANHNAIWNSKKGAAFGFSTIARKCSEDLKKLMPEIVPKLYRYQFDPTPSVHASMSNIWRVLVTDPQNALGTYYHQILRDLLDHINSSQYRVRQSCCLALQDILQGSANRSVHDAVENMDELWTKLFRVMDDHHEATRLTANKTARVLSKLCIRASDSTQGKAGVKMVEAILPIFLNVGITHTVPEIRILSLQTVSELVNSAGNQVKPFLPKLIPALLRATGELESAKLGYLSTRMAGQAETQEAIDHARASLAKSHFATETVSKSLRYADGSMLDELIPKILELMKPSISLGTRIACSHFITLLVVHLGDDVQPYSGKLLAALVNGLTDRNSAVRKHNAVAIGHLVSKCKGSSLEKLFAKLQNLYFEREDDSIRSALAFTVQAIGTHNQEVAKNYSKTVLPLAFFAMHADKSPETRGTLDVWTEIWSEHSPGTESGIRQNIEEIFEMLKRALESSSWTVKAQAANAVATVASKLGASMESKFCESFLDILLTGLTGKTWKGKDQLLKALSSLCSNCKDVVKNSSPCAIIESVSREARKQEITYKISALECLGEVVSSLEIDAFEQVYDILKIVLDGNKEGQKDIEDDEEENSEENVINVKIAAYDTLGKCWPGNSPETQEKFKDLFVDHCLTTLPKAVKSVQVSVLSALFNFVNKLCLLRKRELSDLEGRELKTVVDKLLEAVTYAFGISKHTRLRKEALNVVFCLGSKLKEQNNVEELKKLTGMFSEALVELSNDNQPEVKCRLNDIKQMLL